ncbi:hypothetical protein [Kitasatospora sp. NPDC007106]|uniref:Rv1733c family protein n=1 Tax=Kitasatospora sp. NPDC007106 TaxID=3156914 RepID=UPI0033EDC1E7
MRTHFPGRRGNSRWRRLVVHLRLAVGADAGPLRRPVDRSRSRALLAAWLAVVVAAAGAGAAALFMYWSAQADAARAAARLHRVPAVVRSEPQQADLSASGAPAGGYRAMATWTYPAGHTVTEQAAVPSSAGPGSQVRVWVDDAGRAAGGPRSTSDIVATTGFVVLGGWAAVALTCAVGYSVRRSRLQRRAEEEWQTDWAVVEPTWTGRAGGRNGSDA